MLQVRRIKRETFWVVKPSNAKLCINFKVQSICWPQYNAFFGALDTFCPDCFWKNRICTIFPEAFDALMNHYILPKYVCNNQNIGCLVPVTAFVYFFFVICMLFMLPIHNLTHIIGIITYATTLQISVEFCSLSSAPIATEIARKKQSPLPSTIIPCGLEIFGSKFWHLNTF